MEIYKQKQVQVLLKKCFPKCKWVLKKEQERSALDQFEIITEINSNLSLVIAVSNYSNQYNVKIKDNRYRIISPYPSVSCGDPVIAVRKIIEILWHQLTKALMLKNLFGELDSNVKYNCSVNRKNPERELKRVQRFLKLLFPKFRWCFNQVTCQGQNCIHFEITANLGHLLIFNIYFSPHSEKNRYCLFLKDSSPSIGIRDTYGDNILEMVKTFIEKLLEKVQLLSEANFLLAEKLLTYNDNNIVWPSHQRVIEVPEQ